MNEADDIKRRQNNNLIEQLFFSQFPIIQSINYRFGQFLSEHGFIVPESENQIELAMLHTKFYYHENMKYKNIVRNNNI